MPVTLQLQFVLLIACYLGLVEETPTLCEGASASAEIIRVSFFYVLSVV